MCFLVAQASFRWRRELIRELTATMTLSGARHHRSFLSTMLAIITAVQSNDDNQVHGVLLLVLLGGPIRSSKLTECARLLLDSRRVAPVDSSVDCCCLLSVCFAANFSSTCRQRQHHPGQSIANRTRFVSVSPFSGSLRPHCASVFRSQFAAEVIGAIVRCGRTSRFFPFSCCLALCISALVSSPSPLNCLASISSNDVDDV